MARGYRFKPYVVKTGMGWCATVVSYGHPGNYVYEELHCPTWREAFDWAYEYVKGWRWESD